MRDDPVVRSGDGMPATESVRPIVVAEVAPERLVEQPPQRVAGGCRQVCRGDNADVHHARRSRPYSASNRWTRLTDDRAFADGRGDALDVAGPHVTDREHAGQAGLEQERRRVSGQPRVRQLLGREIGAGLDESLRVQGHAAVEPPRVRHRARHHEHVPDGPCVVTPVSPSRQVTRSSRPLPSRPTISVLGVQRDVRALLDAPDQVARHRCRPARSPHQDVHVARRSGRGTPPPDPPSCRRPRRRLLVRSAQLRLEESRRSRRRRLRTSRGSGFGAGDTARRSQSRRRGREAAIAVHRRPRRAARRSAAGRALCAMSTSAPNFSACV